MGIYARAQLLPVAFVPPGLGADHDQVDEVLRNLQEAIRGHLAALRAIGLREEEGEGAPGG